MADQRHRADRGWLLGAEPRRDNPGRRRDWQSARAALEQLAGWVGTVTTVTTGIPTANDPAAPLAATSAARNATAASWQEGVADAPAAGP
jgi:hypothetical protein